MSETLSEIFADVSEDIFDIASLNAECTLALNDLLTIQSAKWEVLEVTNEASQQLVREQYLAFEDGAWTKIKAKFTEWINKIKEFFRKLWIKIKTAIVEGENKGYESKRYEVARAIEKGLGGNTKIRIRDWNPVVGQAGNGFGDSLIQSFAADIKFVQTKLAELYDRGYDLCQTLIKKPDDPRMIDKIRTRISGNPSPDSQERAANSLNSEILDIWNEICTKIGLQYDSKNPADGAAIRDSINKKYYKNGDPKEKIETTLSGFIKSADLLEWMFSPAGCKDIKQVCDTINNKSPKMIDALSSLERFKRDAQLKQDTQFKDDIWTKRLNLIESSVLQTIREVMTITSSLGTEFWVVYMNLRGDLKTAIKAYVKLNNKAD